MRCLLLCLASLALGFAVGFLVRGPSAAMPRTDPAKPVIEGPVGKPRPATSDLARALEAIPTVERPQGDGKITGRVVDLDGKPLSGVRISLRRQSGGDPYETVFRVADAPDLETAVRQYVDWWRVFTTPVAETTSSEDGSFVFKGLANLNHHVSGHLKGHAVRLRDPSMWEVRPGGRVDLVAHPLFEVHVDVLLPNGSRPERATVWFSPQHAGSSKAEWTPAEPLHRVVPGKYEVFALVGEDPDTYLESHKVQIAVKADGPPAKVVLRVLPGIHGVVEFAREGRITRVTMRTLRFERGEPPSGTRLVAEGKRGSCAWGWYRVAPLEPGRYAVGVATGRDLLLASKVVELGPASVRLNFHEKDLDLSGFLRLWVHDPKGRLLRDAGVRMGRRGSGWTNPGFPQADGSYLVPFPRGSSPGDPLFVEVKSEDYGTKLVEYERVDAGELEVNFGATASLTVELLGTQTAGEFWVGLRRPHAIAGRGVQASSHEPSGPGRFLVQPLGLGDYELLVISRLPVIVARKTVTLAAGENRAQVTLPPLSVLTIRGLKPEMPVLVRPDEEIRWNVLARAAGANGTVVLDGLPQGRYELRTLGGGSMAVRVDRSMEIQFEPDAR